MNTLQHEIKSFLNEDSLLKLNFHDYPDQPIQAYFIITKSKVLSSMLDEFRTHPAKVLDLGAGTGDLMIDLADWQSETQGIGYDLLNRSVDIANRKISKKNLGGRLHVQQKNIETKFDFVPEEFDLITMIGSIQFVSNPESFLKEKLSYLKKNGILLIAAHNKYCLYGIKMRLQNIMKTLSGRADQRYKFFSPTDLKQLATNLGLTVEDSDGFVIMPPWLYKMIMSGLFPSKVSYELISLFMHWEIRLKKSRLKHYLSRTLTIKCRKPR